MTFYARCSWLLLRQVLSDVGVLAWGAAWWMLGGWASDSVSALAGPARQGVTLAAEANRQLTEAAAQTATVPMVGNTLAKPLETLASTANTLGAASAGQIATIERIAAITGVVVFLIPTVIVLGYWLPARVTFARRARQTKALARLPKGADLLALRALVNRQPTQLARISADPLASWREGDRQAIRALAVLELKASGVRTPKELS